MEQFFENKNPMTQTVLNNLSLNDKYNLILTSKNLSDNVKSFFKYNPSNVSHLVKIVERLWLNGLFYIMYFFRNPVGEDDDDFNIYDQYINTHQPVIGTDNEYYVVYYRYDDVYFIKYTKNIKTNIYEYNIESEVYRDTLFDFTNKGIKFLFSVENNLDLKYKVDKIFTGPTFTFARVYSKSNHVLYPNKSDIKNFLNKLYKYQYKSPNDNYDYGEDIRAFYEYQPYKIFDDVDKNYIDEFILAISSYF